MRVFVTGASGFVGSAVVQELMTAGHRVLGMVRSEEAAQKLIASGAEVHRGNLDDLESIKKGAAACDAVIHTAFNHDFSKFRENCEADRRVIGALAAALAGSSRPLVVTSGIGLLSGLNRPVTEADLPAVDSQQMPRVATEEAARAATGDGVDVYLLRLPPSVHGKGDHGFVPMLIDIARKKEASAYIGEGLNQWPAVHRLDAAVLYRLIVEQRPSQKIFHAVAERGIPFRQIAKAIADGLDVPLVTKPASEAAEHFGWFNHFAQMDCTADAAQTIHITGWQPQQPELIEDIRSGVYF